MSIRYYERIWQGRCGTCGQRPLKTKAVCAECSKKMKEVSAHRFFISRAHALAFKHQVDIAPRDLWCLWHTQRGRCALSGRRLTKKNAELDHILPVTRGGKTEISNLRWLDKTINHMRRNLTDEEFFSACREILALTKY